MGGGGSGSGHDSHTDTGSEQQVRKETRPDAGDALAAKVPSISMENRQAFQEMAQRQLYIHREERNPAPDLCHTQR